MRYVLGIDIGSTRIAAAICRRAGESWAEPEVVRLTESVLHVAEDATIRLGQAVPDERDRLTRGFLRRVGDEVPFLLGDEFYTPEALTAAAAGWVVDEITEARGAEPERVALTHPPGWGAYRRGLLQAALADAGLSGVLLLPGPIAAAENHLVRERVEVGTTVAVCRLGGEHVDTAVLRRGPAVFELIAHGEPAEPRAGAAIDDVLAEYVGGQAERTVCVRAKEMLSMAPEVTVPTPDDLVRVARPEFERLIRPLIEASLAQLRRYEPVSAALLAGGTAKIPLVAEIAAEALNCRVVVDPDPGTVVCRGAALAARPPAEALPESTALVPRVTSLPELDSDELYDIEPAPPRPPVVVTPLERPKRRFVKGGRE
ncbi:MAG TPA: Hsp70 family protein [Amycolatopsis sp.]|uniref:Hsp70 family protein n=1 Tax=Amycolatopsis sp. TaxID=37632 RepID=UPI002B4898F2|nr:Hsp70 family protein [Amycolatopsis sp.]HKS47336.1 Hsp70 family protein [Amycolatopsis sp.]